VLAVASKRIGVLTQVYGEKRYLLEKLGEVEAWFDAPRPDARCLPAYRPLACKRRKAASA
jgi:hypothetical protein